MSGRFGGRLGVVLAVVVLGTILLLVAGAEAAIRYRERNRESPGMMFIYYPHMRLRQALVRNSQYYRWVHINGQGFRGARDVGPKAPGVLRMFVVGESTTFDQSVSADSLTWPARLEHWLRRTAPSCSVEVINAGVPGYRLQDNLIRLHTELVHYKPDVIVLYHPHNDLYGVIRFGQVEEDPNRPFEANYPAQWSRWLTRKSLLYAKLRSRANNMGGLRAAHRSPEPSVEQMNVGVGRYQDELSTFLTIAQSRGIKVVLVQAVHVSGSGSLTEPDTALRRTWAMSLPRLSTEALLAAYDRFDRGARETARQYKVDFIDTRDFGIRGKRWFAPGDPIHFNDLGADAMGKHVATALLSGPLAAEPRCPGSKAQRP